MEAGKKKMNHAAAHPILSSLIFFLFLAAWLVLMGFILPKLGVPT
jgi:hypothetical protein